VDFEGGRRDRRAPVTCIVQCTNFVKVYEFASGCGFTHQNPQHVITENPKTRTLKKHLTTKLEDQVRHLCANRRMRGKERNARDGRRRRDGASAKSGKIKDNEQQIEVKTHPSQQTILRERTIPGLPRAGMGMKNPPRMALPRLTAVLPPPHPLTSGMQSSGEKPGVTPASFRVVGMIDERIAAGLGSLWMSRLCSVWSFRRTRGRSSILRSGRHERGTASQSVLVSNVAPEKDADEIAPFLEASGGDQHRS
jgi:hypothetical protein